VGVVVGFVVVVVVVMGVVVGVVPVAKGELFVERSERRVLVAKGELFVELLAGAHDGAPSPLELPTGAACPARSGSGVR